MMPVCAPKTPPLSRTCSCTPRAAANPALRYIDLAPGSGPEVAAGATVTVHFDCIYKGIDAVSSRSARVLSGNRTLAEVSGGAGVAPCGQSQRLVHRRRLPTSA